MVGFEGDRPSGVVRVIAKNPVYPNLKREVDVPQREDGLDWQPGHEIGLHGTSWGERGDAEVYAIITEIVK
jgi:hypothetical protein